MSDKEKITIAQPTVVNGNVVRRGTKTALPRVVAREMIHNGRAVAGHVELGRSVHEAAPAADQEAPAPRPSKGGKARG